MRMAYVRIVAIHRAANMARRAKIPITPGRQQQNVSRSFSPRRYYSGIVAADDDATYAT